jgi:hypothetical protein
MKNMFADETLQKEFDEKGYVTVPLLTNEKVEELTNFYATKNRRHEGYDGTYAEFSVLNAEKDIRKSIFNEICSVILPAIQPFMGQVKPVLANFVCKDPSKGCVPVHQNWAVVDETKYSSVSIWCPLVDVDEYNGALAFVDGSHKKFRGPRGGYADRNFMNIEDDIISNYLTYVPVKAGTAIVLDDSIVHYSPPNQTGALRLAVQLIVIPVEAHMCYFSVKPTNNGECIADVYEVDEEYYLTMDNWLGDLFPYNKVYSLKFENKLYTMSEFVERMKS